MEPRTSLSDWHTNGASHESVLTNYQAPPRQRERYGLHLLLFIATFVSTMLSGGQWASRFLAYDQSTLLFDVLGFPITTGFLLDGLLFAFALLLFLTVHEFGHYFAARRHGVDTSLPYFIPAPLLGIGTFGAVIRIREPVPSLRKLFDIGAAGPLAGFVVALVLLVYALATLPPPSYLFDLPGHEEVKAFIEAYGTFPADMLPGDPSLVGQRLVVGETLLYWALTQFFGDVPPMYEMYHYSLLFGAWLGLFFTALNLLPVGQLDGGHITYALFGARWHRRIARATLLLLMTSAAIGFANGGAETILLLLGQSEYAGLAQVLTWFVLPTLLYLLLHRVFAGDLRQIVPPMLGIVLVAALSVTVLPVLASLGYSFWFVWCVLLIFFVRVEHPPVLVREPLTPARRALGYLCILIFLLCFSIRPLYVV